MNEAEPESHILDRIRAGKESVLGKWDVGEVVERTVPDQDDGEEMVRDGEGYSPMETGRMDGFNGMSSESERYSGGDGM